MTRLVFYIALSLAITAGAAWLISLPGTLTIDVAGYRLQPGLGATGVALVTLIVVSIAIWAIVRRILEAPQRLARIARQRRKDLGIEALSDGFIALKAGDMQKARASAKEAQLRLPGNTAAQLLEASADLALGDLPAARAQYKALISNPKTALAALSGLYEQAETQGRNDVALTFARKALTLAPGTAWAGKAVFDDLTANSAWEEALEMVAAQPAASRADRAAKRHRRAVLHSALAQGAETTDPDSALTHALAALKLEDDFVPAALIAARIQINRGEARRAQSLLRRVWRTSGHPHVALLFANARPGASAIERLKRMRDLTQVKPDERTAAMVLARAAVDAYEWPTARTALAPYAADKPSQGICLLMAEIEEGQNGDQGKAREWLARAVRAPRDPVWVADGITSDEWEPVSPLTGQLDAFAWKVPVSAVANRKSGMPGDSHGSEGPEETTPALPENTGKMLAPDSSPQ